MTEGETDFDENFDFSYLFIGVVEDADPYKNTQSECEILQKGEGTRVK